MAEIDIDRPAPEISGKRFLASIGAGIAASAVIGGLSYFVLRPATSNVRVQAVVALVYATLIATLCVFFKSPSQPPISFRFAGTKSLIASIGVLVATVAVAALFYLVLSPVIGPLPAAVRQIIALATDAKRLQGQSAIAWSIAITRGVLLVPLFEEVFFRGILLSWLRKHMREDLAVVAMAALFTLEHGSFIVGPYAFLLGITMGYVRLRTNSTLNTWIMHSLHNAALLAVGLRLFGQM